MSSTPTPDRQRPPQLTADALHQALDELDAKIKTLHNRAHATAAGSPSTYQQHAAALEAKRARLAEQLRQTPAPASASATEPSVWAQIRRGIEGLRQDLADIL